MTTFVESAYIILKEEGNPLTASEIYKKALAKGLICSNGKTPDRTLWVAMYLENQYRADHNKKTRFKRIGKHGWTLSE